MKKFALVVCTYMRPHALLKLLKSVECQSLYPDQIIIVDGSTDSATKAILTQNTFNNLLYYKVGDQDRGLTKQRNFGVEVASPEMEVCCFLDDDIVLTKDYFENLLNTFKIHPDALGACGYIIGKGMEPLHKKYRPTITDFCYDGWRRREDVRFIVRKLLGLDSDRPPGISPDFSHARSIGFLPPSGKIYPVELLMGGVSVYLMSVLKSTKFSIYFEGYGLYEDADFSLRVAKQGKLYVNTKATLYHFHEVAGRPDKYKYGKMVVRNGWYVWRIKTPNPSLIVRMKWNLITILLTIIRFSNIFTKTDKYATLMETLGRISGYFSLLTNKPTVDNEK